MAEWHGVPIVFADIPGLIEGAHEGKGLGHDFLKHVERTRILFHLVDMSAFDGRKRDPYDVIQMINKELSLHSPKLMKKPTIIVANKMDTTGAEDALKALKKKLKRVKVFPISAATGKGLDPLLAYAAAELAKPEPPEEVEVPTEPHRFLIELDFEIGRSSDGGWIIERDQKLGTFVGDDQFYAGGRDAAFPEYSS